MATRYEISCVVKADGRISQVGGVSINNTRYQFTQEEAIKGIESGAFELYVSKGGRETKVIVATRLGVKYLKTKTDKEQPNNLSSLPTCQGKRLNLYVKVLTDPDRFTVKQMVNEMKRIYATANIVVNHKGTEKLKASDPVLAPLNDIDIPQCNSAVISDEQNILSNYRGGAGSTDIVVYMCRTVTADKGQLNGCASYPTNRPMAVIASYASIYTMAHEVGHVLGLDHVADNDRLMTGGGTDNITNPPPDLVETEITTMLSSPFTF